MLRTRIQLAVNDTGHNSPSNQISRGIKNLRRMVRRVNLAFGFTIHIFRLHRKIRIVISPLRESDCITTLYRIRCSGSRQNLCKCHILHLRRSICQIEVVFCHTCNIAVAVRNILVKGSVPDCMGHTRQVKHIQQKAFAVDNRYRLALIHLDATIGTRSEIPSQLSAFFSGNRIELIGCSAVRDSGNIDRNNAGSINCCHLR